MRNKITDLFKPNPALEPNMNFADIFIRFNIMAAIGFIAVFTQTPALMVLCTLILLENMMGWCPIYHFLGINNHCKK